MNRTESLPAPPPLGSEAAPGPDPGSFAATVGAYQTMVWRYLRLLGADADEADDLMQDTFVQFAGALARVGALQSVPAFLRGIARNLLLAYRRRQRREPPVAGWLDAVDALAAADPAAFADRRLDALQHCLQRLEGRARQAIEWHHLQGLSRRDTAAQLGLGEEGTKSLLARARAVLRQCVEQRLDEENR